MNIQRLRVGSPSPYLVLGEGTKLDIGPKGLTLVVSLPSPLKEELRAVRRGKLDIGMMMFGSSAVVLWRFMHKSGKPVVELESPFHIGLLPAGCRRMRSVDANSFHRVMIILQDEGRVCRALRLVSLPAEISRAIDVVVAMQAREASEPRWSPHDHDAEVQDYFRNFPTPAAAFAVTDAAARQHVSARVTH